MSTWSRSLAVLGALAGATLIPAAVAPPAARAAGFLIYEMSAEALGKASAVTASTREPAAVWFNPGALAATPSGVSLSSVAVFARSKFDPEGNQPEVQSKLGSFVLPTVFANARLGDSTALALGVFPAFGLSIEWPADWMGREHAIKAQVQTVNFNPTIAFRLTPWLSIGAGFQAVRGTVEFYTGLPALVGGATGTSRLGGGTWGYGGNAGLLLEPMPELAFGLAYRSRVVFDFEGRVDFDPLPDFEPSLPDQGGNAELTLPDVASFGVMWRAVPSLALTFDVTYVLWSTYDELFIDFDMAPDRRLVRNNENSFTLRLGLDWATPAEGLHLRAGFIVDRNPSPEETLAPSLPDANRLDFAAGVGYRKGWFKADAGYLLVWFLPSDSTSGAEGPVGTYKSWAQLLGVTLSALFD